MGRRDEEWREVMRNGNNCGRGSGGERDIRPIETGKRQDNQRTEERKERRNTCA